MKRTIALVVLSTCWHLAQAVELSVAEVEASIQHSGAKSTIADLQRREQWQTVTDMIDTGDSAWIDLVPRLARGVDDVTADDLARSLSHALPKNPRSVLTVLTAQVVISPARVCAMALTDEDAAKDRALYKREALHALDGVDDQPLASAKTICVNLLKRSD